MNNNNNDSVPRILVVDDNAAIHEDFRKIFGGGTKVSPLADLEEELFSDKAEAATAGPAERFRVEFASQGPEALEKVEAALKAGDPYAVAFVDVRMPPGWDGVETLERIWKVCPDLQAVICTAYSDYSWPEIFDRMGCTDKLLILKKPFETMEVLQLAHALARKWHLAIQARLRMDELEQMAQERARKLVREMEVRVRAETALRDSEDRFSTAFQSSPLPMAIQTRPAGRFLAVNSSFLELAGFASEQILQSTTNDLRLWEGEADLNARLQRDGSVRHLSCVLRRRDGARRNVLLCAEPLTADEQPCLLLVAEDITERLKIETGLRQTQKLEVVGRLVSSVAHEFNNVLAIIQGRATLLQSELDKENHSNEHLGRILAASERAAKFTRQLLGISRQQPLKLSSVNLPACIDRVRELLEQSLCSRHELKAAVPDGLPTIRADEFNVEQVLMNLIINARDAMPDGGNIVVGACVVELNEAYAQRHNGAKAGKFVCLAVSDRGSGISRQIIDRIFEPFFTTKEVDKGTGLGLWMVQNIVRQHGGWIELVSEVGQGSTFKIFFPVWNQAESEEAEPEAGTPSFAAEKPALSHNGSNHVRRHDRRAKHQTETAGVA